MASTNAAWKACPGSGLLTQTETWTYRSITSEDRARHEAEVAHLRSPQWAKREKEYDQAKNEAHPDWGWEVLDDYEAEGEKRAQEEIDRFDHWEKNQGGHGGEYAVCSVCGTRVGATRRGLAPRHKDTRSARTWDEVTRLRKTIQAMEAELDRALNQLARTQDD